MKKIITYYINDDYNRIIYDPDKDETLLIIENDEAIGTMKIDNLQEIIYELIYSYNIEYIDPDYIDILIDEILSTHFRQDEIPYIFNVLQEIHLFK